MLADGIPCVVLRPTLMFGWFDRKHPGWISRVMPRTPLFPIPGTGRYLRQPLSDRDFCRIRIPSWAFWFLLHLCAVFDRNPLFTTRQLRTLLTPDRFEVIPWDQIMAAALDD